MKVTVTNFQQRDVEPYVKLVEDIVAQEFSELNHLFDELRILIGNADDIRNGLFWKQAKEFLGNTELVSLTKDVFVIRNWANPPKALIEINLSTFETYEQWKQKLAIRHECCHLLHYEKSPAIFNELLKGYSQNYLNDFVRYMNEYCAHLCVIQRYPNDWMIEPLGFRKTKQSPSVFYNITKAKEGTKAALHSSIKNIVYILSVLYLYESLPPNLKSKVKKKKKVAKKYLADFFKTMKKDLPIDFPPPENWLTPEDFLSSGVYFEKVQKLFALVFH
jgi:hypothetical protein